MTLHLEIDPVKEAATIAAQNDTFRRTILPSGQQPNAPQGKIVMTQGISALGPIVQQVLMQQVPIRLTRPTRPCANTARSNPAFTLRILIPPHIVPCWAALEQRTALSV